VKFAAVASLVSDRDHLAVKRRARQKQATAARLAPDRDLISPGRDARNAEGEALPHILATCLSQVTEQNVGPTGSVP